MFTATRPGRRFSDRLCDVRVNFEGGRGCIYCVVEERKRKEDDCAVGSGVLG
jgi:hypothetical protein